MSGNRFGVGQLWDGVKQAVTDAFNTVAQGFTGTLKEMFGLATKYLPQINLIVKVIAYLPGLIGAVGDGVKNLPKAFESTGKAIQSTISNVQKTISSAILGALRATEKTLRSGFNAAIKPLPKNIQAGIKATFKPLFDVLKNSVKEISKQLSKLSSTIVKGVKTPIDAVGKLLKTDIARIPKLIENKVTGIVKAVQKIPGDIGKLLQKLSTDVTKAVQKIPADVGKNVDAKVKDINRNFTDALKRFDKAADDIAAKTLQPIKAVQKGVDDAGKAITKVAQDTVKGVGSKVDETGKSITKSFGEANKRFDDSLRALGKQAGQSVDELKLLPKRAADQVAREVQVITKDVTRAGQETAKVVGKSVDDLGKNVGKIAQQADDTAKVVTKVAPFLDDIIKIALNAAPIIDGFADYMQFEELKLLLETVQGRQEAQTKAISDLAISAFQTISKLEKIQDRMGVGDNTVKVDLNPVLNAIAALPKTGGIASSAEIAAAVAAKIPKPDTIAIADAVAAKIPKPIDNTAILTKTIQDAIKAAPPGQTVSSEAIAAAVAAKIPKPETATTIAIAVKEKMGPEFKAISEKLPDNGIYRVDQTGIAIAVKEKMGPEFKAIAGKLPDNGIYRVDQTGIAIAVKEKMGPEFKAIQPTKIPPDLARKSDLNITVNPTPVTVKPTPVTVNPTPVTVSIPPTDLSPIDTQLKDISKAIGVEQLKNAAPVDAEKLIKKAGEQQFAGGSVQGATTIAGLMAAFAAPQFFRSGSHRLGGSFDQSLMNPAAGKVQINDAMGYKDWQFKQLDERLGMPTQMQVVGQTGVTQTRQFRSIQDSVEEINGVSVSNAQDLEIVERYLFALTQDIQKLMQIALQTREDVDVLIDDSGCKTKDVKRSHPTHIKLTSPGETSSLTNMFQQGQVHYVARQWADSADKNQKLERMSYDTQIAAMSNKFEFDKAAPELPLQKSRATDKPVNDELWRTYVSTMEEPPEGYTTPGNPRPDIKEIKNGNPVDVPKPTNPLKKLGKPS